MGKRVIAALVAVSALAIFASTASAGTVSYFGSCFNSGTATTTAGELRLKFGWATSSVKLTDKFLTAQRVQYTVNGDASGWTIYGDRTNWSPITTTVDGNGNTIYVSYYTTPVLANLASGESVTVSIVADVKNIVWDDSRTHFGPGLLWTEKSCTVTAN